MDKDINIKKLLELDSKWADIIIASKKHKKSKVKLLKYKDAKKRYNEDADFFRAIEIDSLITESDIPSISEEEIEKLIQEFKDLDCFLTPYYIERLESLIDKKTVTKPASTMARSILLSNPPLKDIKKRDKDTEKVTPQEVADMCREHLKSLDGWEVHVVPHMYSRININGTTVNISERASFERGELKGVIAHEIQTHAYRLDNGRKLGLWLFVLGMNGSNEANEGLAIFNQIAASDAYGSDILRNITLKKVICHELAERKRKKKDFGIKDVFKYMTAEFPNISKTLIHTSLARATRCRKSVDDSSYIDSSVYYDGLMSVTSLSDKQRELLLKYPVSVAFLQSSDFPKLLSFLKSTELSPIDLSSKLK